MAFSLFKNLALATVGSVGIGTTAPITWAVASSSNYKGLWRKILNNTGPIVTCAGKEGTQCEVHLGIHVTENENDLEDGITFEFWRISKGVNRRLRRKDWTKVKGDLDSWGLVWVVLNIINWVWFLKLMNIKTRRRVGAVYTRDLRSTETQKAMGAVRFVITTSTNHLELNNVERDLVL